MSKPVVGRKYIWLDDFRIVKNHRAAESNLGIIYRFVGSTRENQYDGRFYNYKYKKIMSFQIKEKELMEIVEIK